MIAHPLHIIFPGGIAAQPYLNEVFTIHAAIFNQAAHGRAMRDLMAKVVGGSVVMGVKMEAIL